MDFTTDLICEANMWIYFYRDVNEILLYAFGFLVFV
jgi:hypothetical protein